ncbi:MmgE/PrpD family protein [Rhodococcus oxybenzonivorans]|uniref:MmgE/PrpD family protein n=1 Tax=Rhodococcus TaxID=1827 RepID=UPI001BCE60F9
MSPFCAQSISDRLREPSTPLEGKFSLRFTTAMAFVTGDLSEQAFSPVSLIDPQVVALRDRVQIDARTSLGSALGHPRHQIPLARRPCDGSSCRTPHRGRCRPPPLS